MKQSMRFVHCVALLAAGVGLCFTAGTAHAQRGGRSASRTAATAGSTNAQSSSSSGGQTGGCMSGGSSSSSGTSTSGAATATTSTGVTSQSTASGTLAATRLAANSALVRYTGSTSNVQTVYLAVLDANGAVVSQRAVTQGTAQASLTLNSSAKYYGAMVVYSNGTRTTTYTPIR